EGKLKPADMQGATFTISSLGGIGGQGFTPIINAPEVAILGLARTAMKPVWDGAQFVPRMIMPMSLSYDHRVVDGALGARFITFRGSALRDLRTTLLSAPGGVGALRIHEIAGPSDRGAFRSRRLRDHGGVLRARGM